MAARTPSGPPVVVIGAGIAGLVCATVLAERGEPVVVVDKGRGVGGRMASRRIGDAVADHGAQYFTARSAAFSALVGQWAAAGVVEPWFTHGDDEALRGAPAMTAPAKHLADGLDVRVGWAVTSVAAAGRRHWQVAAATPGGPVVLDASAVVVTAPVPQARALLDAGGVVPAAGAAARLGAVAYDPCVAVLVVPPPGDAGRWDAAVPGPGWVRPAGGTVAWVADNRAKGVSAVPAFTVHLGTDASAALLDAGDDEVVAATVADPAAAGLGADAPGAVVQVVRWRYARVSVADPGGPVVAATVASGPLVVAGDGFAGPRVEAAALSGLAAADLVAQR